MEKRIQQIRNELRLSQAELGEKIGLTRSGVSNLENGKRKVSNKHIKLLCSELNINESWLRTGDGNMFKDESGHSLDALEKLHPMHTLTRAFVEALISMPPEQEAVFVQLVREVAARVRAADYDAARPENIQNSAAFEAFIDASRKSGTVEAPDARRAE